MNDHDHGTGTLVLAAQSGDKKALDALFGRYLPRVARMVAARLRVPRASLSATADDIAQDALIKALAGLPRFEMRSPGAFANWMSSIVTNHIRSHIRDSNSPAEQQLWARYGDLDLSESLLRGDEPSPTILLRQMETNEALEAALLRLPSQYRDMLAFRYFGEMTYAEIAHATGRTEVSCRKLVQRAKLSLREELPEDWKDSS